MKITPNNITHLKPNEIFVFGSNMLGHHAGGAARTAVEKFGAVYGQPVGLQGQSYALPTLDANMNKVSLEQLKGTIERFTETVLSHPNKRFLLTEIGCGIAGFKVSEIAPLFEKAFLKNVSNLSFPQSFIDYLTNKIKSNFK